MSTLDTAALRALADAATPGPWSVSTLSPHIIYSETDCRPVAVVVNGETPWFNEADAELIAALHPDTVRALCDAADEVERLRTDLFVGARAADDRRAEINRLRAERDASRTAHAALVADLRALVGGDELVSQRAVNPDEYTRRTGDRVPSYLAFYQGAADLAAVIRALLDRHAPTTGETP